MREKSPEDPRSHGTFDQKDKDPIMLQLIPELRAEIIKRLDKASVLQLRLTCKTLKSDVNAVYNNFRMEILGDTLTSHQMRFINQINLRSITFKRVAKPLYSLDTDDDDSLWNGIDNYKKARTKIPYPGSSQYFQVGGIQVRRLSAPCVQVSQQSRNNSQRTVFDFSELRGYLSAIGKNDVFQHI